MISQEEMIKIGESFTNRIIKTEVIEYDKFMPNHEIDFRLSILDRAYTIKVKPDGLDENAVNQIWVELFSSFLATFNAGLVSQTKNKST